MKAAAFVIALATAAQAQNGLEKTSATITVYVHLEEPADTDLNVVRAEGIASLIFADAGVHINWRFGKAGRANKSFPIMVELTTNTPDVLLPGALASSAVYGEAHIRIYLDRIKNACQRSSRLSTPLLAHAMAHEITHILQGVSHHSETGLMKAAWTQVEIEQMAIKPATLTDEDLHLIRVGLAKRDVRQLEATTAASEHLPRLPRQ